jgi:hypothetical protein
VILEYESLLITIISSGSKIDVDDSGLLTVTHLRQLMTIMMTFIAFFFSRSTFATRRRNTLSAHGEVTLTSPTALPAGRRLPAAEKALLVVPHRKNF